MDKLGPTGLRLAARLNELRLQRGYTLSNLEAKLTEAGRPILLSALSKIEKGQRRVDADDLVGLARALDVSPNSLLLPSQHTSDQEVELTPSTILTTEAAWTWATKDRQSSKTRRGVFISYTMTDADWASWIGWQLAKAGYEVALDSWDLNPGDNIRSYIEDCIDRSACIAVVTSDKYIKSDWATTELTLALARPQLAILPIIVDGKTPSSGPLSERQWIRIDDKTETNAKAVLLAAIAKLGVRSRPTNLYPTFPPAIKKGRPKRTNTSSSTTPIHRSIVAFEIVGNIASQSNMIKAYNRRAMYEIVETALTSADFDPSLRDQFMDRGDCLIALIHPSDRAPKTWLLTKLIPKLHQLLTDLNAEHADQVRMKVAIHSGEVSMDSDSFFGEDIDIALRLLNTTNPGEAEGIDETPLTVTISDQIHRSIVRHGYDSIDVADFHPVEFQVSDIEHRAWLYVSA